MDITYIGHSCFKFRGKGVSVITDPYDPSVGFSLPKLSADIVTVSHQHSDHNNAAIVSGTTRREQPYVIAAPGEYEVLNVGVFGWGSYHDGTEGSERGKNTIYSILVDGIRVVHLGDLGHVLPDDLKENLGIVDVLLVPVGGGYTITAEQAVEVITQTSPSIVVPMHYKTQEHSSTYDSLTGLDVFLKAMGIDQLEAKESLTISSAESLGEETEVVVLSPQH